MRRWRKALAALAIAVLALGVAAGGAALWWLQRPLALRVPTVELSIDFGTAPRAVAQAWVQAGVQTSPQFLYQWFRWSGQARQIRAGSYEVEPGTTPRQLLARMVRGDETLTTVRLVEGWTLRQFRAELARAERLVPTTAAMSEAELMAAVGARQLGAELAQRPAVDQPHDGERLVAAHHPGEELPRRRAALDLVAAGADLPRLARPAEPFVEEQRPRPHAGRHPGVGDAARRGAEVDRQLDRLGAQLERAVQPRQRRRAERHRRAEDGDRAGREPHPPAPHQRRGAAARTGASDRGEGIG